MTTEADTCRNCVVPRLKAAGWDSDPHSILEKYATDGELQFTLPDVQKVPPISHRGNVNEIIAKFGGAEQLRDAVGQLQSLLYAA